MSEREMHAMPEGPEPPPRGVGVMAVVRWLILLAVAAVAGWTVWSFWGPGAQRAATQAEARYYCPMHPQITSPEPGECPICHMNIEPIPRERTQPTGPMGAAMVADGGTLPATGSREGAMAMPAGGDGAAGDAALEGVVPVTLTLERQQRVGVATAPVTRRVVGQELRAPAVVEAPEDAMAQVHVRAPGFLERVAVSASGVQVARGQTLAWIYSPEIYRVQQELLTAHRWAREHPAADAHDPAAPGERLHTAGAQSSAMEMAARTNLSLLGLSEGDIDEIVRRDAPLRAVPIRAPRSGFVVRRAAVLGLYATPELALYEIADLSRVWVVASVYERDLPRVRAGAAARFVPASRPGEPITARVTLVEPEVAAATRTARVRLEVANAGLRLRPGEYGDVLFAPSAAPVLVVLRDAVIDDGRQQYVFVDRGEGRFEPRRVRTGALVEDQLPVLEGLREGERVVTRGNFMIDAESRLQSALAATPPPAGGGGGAVETGPDCETAFDRQRYPDRYTQCRACERVHRGMGTMEADCKNAIPRPWR
jgi:Cu(I)/Ag(I) efflux system membrane fusion protein